MRGKAAYLGYNAHWSLSFLRRELADKIGTAIITKAMLGDRNRSGGFYQGRTTGRSKALDVAVETFFASGGKDKKFDSKLLVSILDASVNIEKVFVHTVLSTGAESILYHGNDESTPDNIRLEKGQALIGQRFAPVDLDQRVRCQEEVNQLFPEFASLANDDNTPWDDQVAIFQLWYALIDILVALRTDSRLLLFNVDRSLAVAIKHLPAAKFNDLNSFFQLFERTTGSILTPSAPYDLTGLDRDVFGSKEFAAYCEAHNLLNSPLAQSGTALESLTQAVNTLAGKYKELVDRSTMNWIIARGAEHILKAATGGTFAYLKDFIELVLRLSKENERDIVVYSGRNLEAFCIKLAFDEPFGRPLKSRWKSLFGT